MRFGTTERFLCGLVAAIATLALASTAQGAVFTVTKTADTNETCFYFDCSLREAINAANAEPGDDAILFAVDSGPQVLTPTSALPVIADHVTIDGTSQPGFSGTPIITLNGASAGAAANGLRLGEGADGSTIRGLVVHSFGQRGIEVAQSAAGVTIGGNYIGTDGSADLGNGSNGIWALGDGAVIGGPDEVDRNVVAGNDGIEILIGTGSGHTSGAQVENNYVGVSADGTAAVESGNLAQHGIVLIKAFGAVIRGNLVSGNAGVGLTIDDSNDTNVQLNKVGASAGEGFIPNGTGVHVVGGNLGSADGTRIGSTTPGLGNEIAGNSGIGIAVNATAPGGATDTLIADNDIHDNLDAGVLVASAVDDGGVTIGTPEAGNRIARNGSSGTGVVIKPGSSKNSIRGNRFVDNVGLGIDLGDDGVTANDAGDGDTGANGLLNFPIVGNVQAAGSTVLISGSYNSAASSTFELDFYRSPSCDPTGVGEGHVYLGSTSVTTGGGGSAGFAVTLPSTGSSEDWVTATASDAAGNTSEFSECHGVTSGSTYVVNSAADPGVGECDLEQCTLREAIVAANADGLLDAIEFSIGEGPVTISVGAPLPSVGAPAVIDGTTQPGYTDRPIVELDGADVPNGNGLTLVGDGSVVKGLVINRFGLAGILLGGELGRHTVESSFIGMDMSGTLDRGNGTHGISIQSRQNRIGGTTATGNVISGNGGDGIRVNGDLNVIRGNRVGTNRAGSEGIPNAAGVQIFESSENTIGGSVAGAGNVISGNTGNGITIDSVEAGTTANNVIAGNRIGTQASGTTPLGNGGVGVLLSQSGLGNNVVGPDAAGLNTIAFNGGDGIEVAPESQRERILYNDIESNGGLGIDLGGDGVTANDPGDGDVGANALQNFPVITSAVQAGDVLTVEGTLNSGPNTTHTVQLFRSPSCDPSGNGEGASFLVLVPLVFTDGEGNASFGPVAISSPGEAGDAVTATAVFPTGNTSEFSACSEVVSGSPTFTVTKTADTNDGACDEDCSLREAIVASNAAPTRDTIAFALPGPPFVIQPTSALPATTDSVVIDGTTQLGFVPPGPPVVEINGALAGEASGLTIAGGDSEVRGLVLNGFNAFSQAGILLVNGDGNLIAGNYVGTNGPGSDSAGTAAVPNRYGIVVESSSTGNTIGGTSPGDRNLVSANTFDGIALETAGFGVSTSENAVLGNYVGTDAFGVADLGNGGAGIDVEGDLNTIGGASAGEGNLVSGNTGTGIDISFDAASGNVVIGNLVGTDAGGTTALPNHRGIGVFGNGNTIGGSATGAGNVISGNTAQGILVGGSEDSAEDNVIAGNTVGLNAAGTAPVGNGEGVVVASLASATNIGGPSPAAGNLISGNTGVGLELFGGTTANVVRGNRIGVDATGEPEENEVGLLLSSADGNTIGGPTPAEGNVIGASEDANVVLDVSASGNMIVGNWIGTDTTGTVDLGAVNEGLRISGSSAGNTIGPGNVIAFNGESFTGVAISGGEATGNEITQNSIYENLGLGIDLGDDGVTPNDDGDGDTGPNGLQNFPELTAAASAVETTFVQGTLWSNSDQTYRLEFFASPDCDPSGNGEGRTFLGSTTVTPSAGPTPFSADLGTAVAVGDLVTATATNVASGNTSEFSACEEVVSALEAPDATVTVTADQTNVEAGAGRVKLDAIPPSELLQSTGGADDAESAPINDVPINDVPLAAPINDVPINDVGFPTVADQLGDVALSSIPLLTPGGWPAVLAGTPLAGLPLQSVTLQQVYQLSPLPPQLQPGSATGISLGQLDLSQSPLGGLPSSAILLGPTLLQDLGLTLQQWCQLFSAPPIGCSSPSSLQSSSLLSAALSGAPINDVPINDVPINDVDLTDAPINDVPINDVDLANSPINDVPINDVPINDVPINDVPINDVLANGSPINDVPINDVTNPEEILDCSKVDCVPPTTATLGDALAANAFDPGVTLGDLRDHISDANFPFTLGDIGAWANLTIGDLVASLPPGANITLADVLVLLLGPELFGWEQLDLDSIPLQKFATNGSIAGFNADFQLTGTTSGPFATTVVVELPPGFLYEPGSSVLRQLSPPGPDTPLADPAVTGQSLTYQVTAVIGTGYRIELNARPSITLGPGAADASATPLGGDTAGSPFANLVVGDTFEPNPSASPHPIEADSFYLSYITGKDDLDFHSFVVPAAGSRVTFTLSHIPAGADYDLVVYGPAGSPLRPGAPGTPPLDGPPLEDRGASLRHVVDALPPETLDDAALEDLPLLGVSALRGTDDDAVLVLSGGEPGVYTVQVSGFNDSSSSDPYMLRAQVEPTRVQAPCVPRTFANPGTPGSMPTLAAGLNTVFLVNKEQLEKTYGGAAAQVFSALQTNQAALQTLGFPSAVIPVEANGSVTSAYTAWNACPSDPRAANDVVRAIGGVLDGIRAQRPTLKYVVILGGDDIVPQARLSDFTTLANEYEFADTFGPSTALGGALHNSTYLSDDPYGDIDPVPYLNRQLHVPDLALGRLVEEPADIAAAITRFVLSSGQLAPQSALTTGYDFLSDGAQRVNTALASEVGAGNANALINDSWTKGDFLASFLPASGPGPGLNALNAHADPSALLPAAGPPLIEAAEFAGANLTNRVLFSMGCHAGLSLTDVFITGDNDDWAQTFAQRGAALWAANTGYGYGDTVVNAYGELLNGLFAENLVGGTMRAGEALIYAKHEYLAETGVLGVFDEKSLGELTFYGLPMYAVGTVTPPAPPAPEADPGFVDPITGLEAEAFSVAPSFAEVTTPRGRFLRGDDGEQVSHLRPIQPKRHDPLFGTDAHGALITELRSFDTGGFDPVFARPLVDDSANEPELAFDDVAFPSKIQSVRTFKTVGGTQQRLVLVTGQFFSDGVLDNEGVGVQRRHTRIGGLVYRSDGSDFIAPTFGRIEAVRVGGSVAFSVDVTDRRPSGPGQVVRVLVGFRDGTGADWRFVDLAQSSSGTWTGGAPAAGSQIEYFVQAVDGGSGGNVAVSTNKGFYYEALPAPPPPTGGLDPELSGEPGENGWFTGDVSVVVGAPEGVEVEISVDGGPFVHDANATITGDGIHIVRVRASNGGTATVFVPIDGTAPDIQIATPQNGATYELGSEVLADFACLDAGSGAVFCNGTVDDGVRIDTSSLGPKTFTVSSEDAAGNPATKTVAYTVSRRSIVFSSSRTGFGDIYTVNEAGGGLVRLTAHSAIDAEPAWSPDGSKIAFTSTRNGNVEIYVMNANGSNVQRLTTSAALELSPAWSPDGTKIAFSANRHGFLNFDVYVMNADGSNVTRLTTHAGADLVPAWSPNGQKIAFTSTRTGGSDIYVMNANGSSQTRLTTSSALDAEPDWSPDGTKIAFSTNRHGTLNFELYAMNANGSAQTRLTTNAASDSMPAWSSDGAKIAFVSTRNGNFELYVMNGNGSGQTRVTTNPAIDATPDW